MPDSGSSLRLVDVRRMVSLLGEVAALEENFSGKKRHLMNGLCALIGGDCWVWTLLLPVQTGEVPPPAGFMHGGFSEERFSAYLEAVEHPDMARLNAPFIEAVYASHRHTTRLRQQLDPEDIFPTLAVYPLWQKADIAPVLLSCHPFPDRCLSLIALYRKADGELFSRREARIAHIILSEVPWLHAQSWPEAKRISGQMLAPRVRTTLNYLLEGRSRKQIAAHLGISENTVSGYVKRVYQFYKVQSQAELMKLFRDGDGGDG